MVADLGPECLNEELGGARVSAPPYHFPPEDPAPRVANSNAVPPENGTMAVASSRSGGSGTEESPRHFGQFEQHVT